MQTEEENRRKSFKKPKKELHVICQVDYRLMNYKEFGECDVIQA